MTAPYDLCNSILEMVDMAYAGLVDGDDVSADTFHIVSIVIDGESGV